MNDPVYLERMEMANDLCSWLKRYLWRFTGMSPRNLQAYLNWYVYFFRVNQARDIWDPTERVLASYSDGRRDLPELGVGAVSRVI